MNLGRVLVALALGTKPMSYAADREAACGSYISLLVR